MLRLPVKNAAYEYRGKFTMVDYIYQAAFGRFVEVFSYVRSVCKPGVSLLLPIYTNCIIIYAIMDGLNKPEYYYRKAHPTE